MASNSTFSLAQQPTDLISLSVLTVYKEPLTVKVHQNGTLRDIHLEVSRATSLSRSFFTLTTEAIQHLSDTMFVLLSRYGIRNDTKIYVSMNIPVGHIHYLESLPPERRAVRRYVYGMNPQNVEDFFGAKITLYIPSPNPWNSSIGLFRFGLDQPIKLHPKYYTSTLGRCHSSGGRGLHILRPVNFYGNGGLRGQFSSDPPYDAFDSRGVPVKTVDHLVGLLANLLVAMPFRPI